MRQANQEEALVDPQSQRDLATGEIFTALQAEQYGLVDEIGFIEDAIDRALQLAGLEADRVRVVQYQRPASLMNLVGFAQASEQNHPLYAVLEMSIPRAYYLATFTTTVDSQPTSREGGSVRASVIREWVDLVPVTPQVPPLTG